MATETERKWRLLGEPDAVRLAEVAGEPTRIEQHYLPAGPGLEVRVRRRSGPNGERFVRTTKSDVAGTTDGALVRDEQEHEIDRAAFEAAVAAGTRGTVVKLRWLVPVDDRTFELDHFERPPVGWAVELELEPGEAATVEVVPPAWFGPVVDVTHDPTWRNAALAVAALFPPAP